uniref:FBA_2 domain-containing protein n=2 Tax=Caenorhabditis tropicalis TaxID=1561998 RepID=A0A1I7UMK4_9PELO
MLRKKQMENIHVCIGGDYPSISLGTKSRRTDYLFRVFNLSEIQEDSRIEYLKIGDTVVQTQKSKDERGCIYFYYEDHFIGTQILSEIVSDFFSVPIYRLSVTGDKNINDPRRAIDWIMSRQNSIGRCSMNSSEMSDEDLKRFLDGFIVTDELTLSMKTSDDFMKNLNLQTVLYGIPAIWRETPEDLSYKWSDGEDEPRYFDYFFEVRNLNGAVASIVADNGPNEFFSLYVWPDQNGQQYPLGPLVQ